MSRWRNPRLVLGVVLVLGSAVLGGWLAATARDTTDYWLVRADVRAGEAVTAEHLAVTAGRVDSAAAATLLAVAGGVPDGVWARDVTAGTLATRDAVAARTDRGRELPLSVAAGALPPDLTAGQRVDVWVGPGDDGRADGPARRFLLGAEVLSVSRPDGTGLRTIVVDTGHQGPGPQTVRATMSGQLTVVRVP